MFVPYRWCNITLRVIFLVRGRSYIKKRHCKRARIVCRCRDIDEWGKNDVRVTRARRDCYATVSEKGAFLRFGTNDFKRIEWVLARSLRDRTRQLIFVPRLPVALNKPTAGRRVADVIFRRKWYSWRYLLNINCNFSCRERERESLSSGTKDYCEGGDCCE